MIDEDSNEVTIVEMVMANTSKVVLSESAVTASTTTSGSVKNGEHKLSAKVDNDLCNGTDRKDDSDDDVIMVPVPRVLVLKKDEKTRGYVLGSVELNTPPKVSYPKPKVVHAPYSSTSTAKPSFTPVNNHKTDNQLLNVPSSHSTPDLVKKPTNIVKSSPLSSLNSNTNLVKKPSNTLPRGDAKTIPSSSTANLYNSVVKYTKPQINNSLPSSTKSPSQAKAFALLTTHKRQVIKREMIRQNFIASHPNNKSIIKNKGPGIRQQVAASFGNRIPIPGGGSANKINCDKSDTRVLSTTTKSTSLKTINSLKLKPWATTKNISPTRIMNKSQTMTKMTDLVQSIISESKKPCDISSNLEGNKSQDASSSTNSTSRLKDMPDNTVSNKLNKRVVVNETNGPKGKKVKMCDTDYSIDRVIADKRAKHEKNFSTSPSKPLGPPPTTIKGNSQTAKINPTPSTFQHQISKLPKEVQINRCSADPLLARVLEWKVTWMKENKSIKTRPPPVSEKPLRPLKLTYSSLKEYCDTYEPLILHEIWGHVMQTFESEKSGINSMVAISSYEAMDPFLRIDCQTLSSFKDFEDQKHISEGEMVLMELKADGGESRLVFGYIQELGTEEITKKTLLSRYLKPSPHHKLLLKYHIRTRLRPIILDMKEIIRVTSFYYLRPMLRNIEAVYSLVNSKLCEEILNPSVMACQMAFPQEIKLPDNSYNESQYKSILASVEAVQRPFPIPKMLLVQGPPGTGKTFTLVGMIQRIFTDWDDLSNSPKILVCTPSNGAVDEIARRLHDHRHFLNKSPMNRSLRIVRLGQTNQIHPSVRKFSLDELVESNIKSRKSDLEKTFTTKINSLKDSAAKKDQEIAELRAKNEKDKADKCASEMYQIYRDLKLAQAELSKVEETNSAQDKRLLKLDILRKADVILSTLNSSRHVLLEDLFQSKRDPIRFNCAIIDEASQCAEPELLMPLMYNSISKLILIGDPMQLPATVISPIAAEYNYGRSLFERIFLHFGKYSTNSPVLMLDTQYRMHSQICSFPSLKFYDNRLKTPDALDERPFPAKPYMVFDLRGTVEDVANPKNIVNEAEADFVVTLYVAVREMIPKNCTIGIITPYQGQKRMLINKLENHKDNLLDINTIDGFQGQERDVVILSLVRDFSKRDSKIGFLTSNNRLNVALTRARHSIILCMSDASQVVNELWKELLDDADSRQAVYRTSYKSKKGFQKLLSR